MRFIASEPGLLTMCSSYRQKKLLKRYFPRCYIESSLLQIMLQVLMHRTRKYPNFVKRLLGQLVLISFDVCHYVECS